MIRLSGSSEIVEGFDAVWRADFDRAVALLHNVDAPGCSTMRSRVYLRMGLAKRAAAECERATTLRLHPRERAEMALVGSSAMRAIGDRKRSDELWEESKALGAALGDPLFDLLRLSMAATRDFSDGKLARSKSTAERALRLSDELKHRESTAPYVFEGNHLRARLLEIMSMHAVLAGDHREQERLLIEAVLTSSLVRRRDVFIEVNLLANLSSILMDFSAVRAREIVLSRANLVVWNDHLDYLRTFIKRGLRCNKEVFGFTERVENFGGRGYPTLAWRVADCVDRLLHSNWADRSAFDSEIAFAMELAERVDWQTTTGEEVTTLPSLAALLAPHHVDAAEGVMGTYFEKLKTLSGKILYAWDGRRPALERFAEASIAKARGDFETALARYGESQAYWLAGDMRPRAALVGLERYTMSRDVRDLRPAADFLRTYPTSAFSRRLGRAFEKSPDAGPGDFLFLDQGTNA